MELKNNGYFTPDIEDIRVGYECEQSFITTYDAGTKSERVEESWIPIIIQHIHNYQHPKIQNPVYRVPYLTKEQIEAEGWEIKTDNNNGVIDFEKPKYCILSWNYNLKIIEINDGKTTTRFDNQLYRGQCKDINTFRYICKLLGI